MEYLGYNITRTGIQPIAKKVEAIQAIKRPKTHKQLQGFISIINFYCDMWKNRASLPVPLTALMSKHIIYHGPANTKRTLTPLNDLSGKKFYLPIRTLTLRSKCMLMHAKHNLVPSYPRTENQLHSIPEKWIVHNKTVQRQRRNFYPSLQLSKSSETFY
jgi:hypothetical protein